MGREELRGLARKIYRNHGDALEGEQVIAQARRVGRPIVVTGSSRHQIQEVVLKVNVLCVIDRPFRLKEGRMKIK